LGLCHGDLSPKNVIDRDGVVSVIDWGCARGQLVPHYDLGVILCDGLDEHSREFAALLDGYGLSLDVYHHEMREDVAALRLLEAVDKVRWALDRKPARLPALTARLSTELSAVT
ncbi:MAG: phosphotransferase, partial [Actinobacteria bacterium]|nr:phosphotransferase [Actinomycetota bacterium]